MTFNTAREREREREPFGQVLVNQIMIKNGEDIFLYNLSMWTSHLSLLLEIQLKHMSRQKRGQKRFCSLNVYFRPTGEQPKLAIIFRGKGKRLSAFEKASWDKDVDVYFQKNAWVDTEFCLDWSKKTFKAILKTPKILSYFLTTLKHMFMKALGIQSKILGESHGLVYLMPPTYGNRLMVAMLQP